jgi:hypothetical protein
LFLCGTTMTASPSASNTVKGWLVFFTISSKHTFTSHCCHSIFYILFRDSSCWVSERVEVLQLQWNVL